MAGKAGIVLVVTILLLSGFSLLYVFNAPTQTAGGLTDPSNLPVKGTMNITIYADSGGWNYSHGPINPTLYIPLDYIVTFTVIEEDNLPHTLTINKGAKENSGASLTLVSSGQLTQVPGHVAKATYEFFTTGVYTYWCTFHPATMVAQIQVNATASNGTTANSSAVNSAVLFHSFQPYSNFVEPVSMMIMKTMKTAAVMVH
ncbi:MAG: cupredoxin domain-containing protein [Cuniculiplasma sp.]|jgi:hypothetical protein